jgi:hypothetical protein
MAQKTLKTTRQAHGFHPVLRQAQHGSKHGKRSRAKQNRRMKRGIFITLEGVEGCGKSTHSKLLFNYLKKKGYPCVYTREPGGTRIGEEVRKILLNPNDIRISDLTELFLFEACRCQIVKEIVKPAGMK